MIRHSSTHTRANRLAAIASARARSLGPATGFPRAGSLRARSAGTGWWLLLLLLAGLIGWSGSAKAGAILDPEVLFLGDSSCAAPPGCPVYGSEVNGVGASSLTITENGSGQPTLANPLLLIVGIPNTTGALSLPGITLSAGIGVAGGPDVYPTTTTKWDSNGYAGAYTAGFKGSVYDFVGLQDSGSASESFTNWSAAELAVNGITANRFGIGVYSLTGTGMTGDGSVTVDFASALPVGTFAVAYGCETGGTDSNGACSPGGNVFGTPFTQSAMVTTGGRVPPQSIPDPGSLVLLATSLGLLKGTAPWRARRKGKSSH
jgi:hypothetical protein